MSEAAMGFNRTPYPDCNGTGELCIDNENITAHFEVERQTLISDCPRCRELVFLLPEELGAARSEADLK